MHIVQKDLWSLWRPKNTYCHLLLKFEVASGRMAREHFIIKRKVLCFVLLCREDFSFIVVLEMKRFLGSSLVIWSNQVIELLSWHSILVLNKLVGTKFPVLKDNKADDSSVSPSSDWAPLGPYFLTLLNVSNAKIFSVSLPAETTRKFLFEKIDWVCQSGGEYQYIEFWSVFIFFSKDRWLFTDAAATTWTFHNTRQPWLGSCNESWKFTFSRHTRYSCRKLACG